MQNRPLARKLSNYNNRLILNFQTADTKQKLFYVVGVERIWKILHENKVT